MNVIYQTPVYGENYFKGDIFGTDIDCSLLHGGIAYFQRWDKMGDIECQHVGIVKDENTVIQAHLKKGVHEANIHDMFEDPRLKIYFRRLKGITPEIADELVAHAVKHLGDKYDGSLIVSQAINNSLLGRLVNKLSKERVEEIISALCDSPDEWICSEIIAHILDEHPKYKDVGCLKKSVSVITPQDLIQDEELFKVWHGKAT